MAPELWIFVVFSVSFGLPVGFFAKRRGLSFWKFFFLSVILTPVIGVLAAGVAEPPKKSLPNKIESKLNPPQVR